MSRGGIRRRKAEFKPIEFSNTGVSVSHWTVLALIGLCLGLFAIAIGQSIL